MQTQLEKVIKNIKNLPPTPQILPKLRNLLKDGNSSVNDILSLIKLDQTLAAQIVRASNSPFYGSTSPSQNLEEAISRIGFNEVYKLVAFVASSHVLGGNIKAYGMKPGELFQQSITCATVMQMIAQSKGDDNDTAYTVGLMHSIGKVVINHHCAEKEILLKASGSHGLNHHDETKQIGFNHAEAGAELLTQWQFHDDVIQPVACQFTPTANATYQKLACMLHIAKSSISHLDMPPAEISNTINPNEAYLNYTGITKDELITSIIAAKAAMHDIHDLLDAV